MKAQILKIAGVKSEKDFYRKYPSEEAFMKVHGNTFKKAQLGLKIAQGGITQPNLSEYEEWANNNPASLGGNMYRREDAGIAPEMMTRRGDNQLANPLDMHLKTSAKPGGVGLMPYMQAGVDVVQGLTMLKGQKQAVQRAKQNSLVTGVQSEAASTVAELPERKYWRPEDIPTTGEEFSPIYGTGTNVLAANGVSLNSGGFGDFMTGQQGGDILQGFSNYGVSAMNNGRGPDAGSKIGGGIGQAAGTLFGGPVGGMLGKAAGTFLGGFIDQSDNKIERYNNESQENMNNIMSQNMRGHYGAYMRAGGNLREYTPPSEEYMNSGGELQTHWGGYAEPISENPYLPDGGQTVMFRGQAHDESTNGKSGIGVTYGDSPVEVERGEPAVKLEDGDTGENNLVVYGNLKIPKGFLEDPKSKGRKFKNYVADLSKSEAIQNKLVDKATDKINELTPITSFDKLEQKTLSANILGANMKLKSIADKKIKAAALQQAINDTASERGLVADALSMGRIKQAKNGERITAQNGYQASYIGEIPEQERKNSSFRMQGYSGQDSTQSIEEVVASSSKDYKDLIASSFSTERGFTDVDRKKAYDIMIRESGGKATAVGINNNPNITNPKGQYWNSRDSGLMQLNNIAHPSVYAGGDVLDPAYNIESAAKIAMQSKKSTGDPWKPWVASSGAGRLKTTEVIPPEQMTEGAVPTNTPPTKIEGNVPPSTINRGSANPSTNPTSSDGGQGSYESTPYKFNPWMFGYNQILPYLRGTNAEQLDPRQLTGEMNALSSNQLEPVQTQSYHPQLDVPYDISLQDQLNANQADFRSVQRMVGNNPALLSHLTSQKYQANQQVLGNQFRANQAEKDKVYSQNRNTLNDSQWKNIGIYDKQYERQSQALSNTKATTQEALNSISAKYQQNQLSNRKLQTYENLYNYRYDRQGRAINENGLQEYNIQGNPGTTSTKSSRSKVIKSSGGSIVRALKDY